MNLAVAHKLEVYDPGLAEPCPDERLVLPVRTADAVMGETVSSFLARAGWRFDMPTICVINGECYARAEWETRYLALNDNVEFLSRPMGPQGGSGGASAGKSIGAIVGLLALTILAPYAMGAIGLTGVAASIGSSLLIAGGSLLLSHLMQPKPTGKSAANEEIYSFSFQANTARPLQAIPVGYGRRLNTPDLAAPSYSEFSGDSMVEYGLYCLGCGRYDLEELRIDDTTIWTKAVGFDPSFPGIQVQLVEPGQQVTLFPANVVTASEVSGVELTTTATSGYTLNAAGTLADQILIDLVWPSGAFQTYKDRTLATSTHVLFDARVIDAAGAPLGDWFPLFSKVYNFAKQSQIRVTEHIPVGPGRYQIRGRRVNPSITGQTLYDGKVSGTDTVQWTAARAHIQGPMAFPGVTVLAVRAEANASLNGVTNGKLRTITTRILPVWNGSGFVEQPTRSIAWAALDAWRNADYSAGLSVDNVDFQSFVAYDALWASRDDTFDHFFTSPDSLDNVLTTILKAGRAFPAFIGDRLTIVREEPRGIPRMMFNDFNMIAGSLTIDYVLADPQFADGVSGQYLDETSWKLADITSAPGGALLNKPAQIEVTGVVKRRQAAELVRFHAAEHQYRRVTVTWQTGAEGKLLKQGDLVTVSSEQPETWGQSAEIASHNEAAGRITLNPAPVWDDEALWHYVQIQRRDGQPWGPVRCTKAATDDTLVLVQTDLAAEATRQGMTLWDAIARSDLMEAPLVDFSPGQPRSYPVLIVEGTPDMDGEHMTLKGVQDAPGVYDIDGVTGVPPLPTIPDLRTAAVPTIDAIGIQIFQRGLNLILAAGWQPAKGALTYEADLSYDLGETWVPAYRGERTVFEAVVSGAQIIRVRVRGRTADGTLGGYAIADEEPPNLVAAEQYVTFKLTKDDFEQKIARVFDSLDLLQVTADLAAESTVLADEAYGLGKAAIKQIAVARVDIDKAYAIFGTTVQTSFDTTGATLSSMLEALSTTDQALAQQTDTVEASVGSLSTTVTQQATAQALVNGQLFGSYIVKVDTGGYWSGFQILTEGGNGATNSEFRIATDRFLIGPPGGGAASAVFVVGTVGGVARVTVRGDLFGDGTIGAAAIQAQSLSAISANLGTITAGNIIFPPGAGSIQMHDNT